MVPFRTWVGFKESKYGGMGAPYRAWFSTCTNNSDNGGGDVLPDNDEDNVRRMQMSDTAVAGNLDLLTIPGVGQRNLRKLVEKGFEGVAQLKQLYKDKVWRIILSCFLICTEHEKLGFEFGTLRPMKYDQIAELLNVISERFDWEKNNGRLIKTIIDAVLGLNFDYSPNNLVAAALVFLLASDHNPQEDGAV
ncbi:glutamate-cysteine ligase [Perilla frutescens var. frutescens]|nr:glutamate-cysteine ligase [Perilla frutescens var. frutescens]